MRTLWIWAIFILCASCHVCVSAQELGQSPAWESRAYTTRIDSRYLRSIADDTVYILKSPLRFGEDEWRNTVILAGATAALIVYDRDIQRWAQRNKIDKWLPTYTEDNSDRVARWVKPLGDFDQVALPLAAFYLYGRANDDNRAMDAVLTAAKAVIVSSVIGQSLKFAIDRERPSGLGIHHEWAPDSFSEPGLSMPSGHAINAFAVATVFSEVYGDRRWVPPLAYGLAALAAASRVHENRHWTSDIFVGSCIGYFTAKAIVHRGASDRLTLTPSVQGDGLGMVLHYRF